MNQICASLQKQNRSNHIVDVYSLNGSGIPITKEAMEIMLGSARCYREVDVTEAMSFTHCQEINKDDNVPIVYTSEGEYQKHYNKTIGPLTKNKSIPDGSMTVGIGERLKLNLLSVFRLTQIREGYVIRKIQKFPLVASCQLYDASNKLVFHPIFVFFPIVLYPN